LISKLRYYLYINIIRMTTFISNDQTPKDNSILNIFLVDKTGSMHTVAKETVSGFQEFKTGLKKNSDPNIKVTYALGLFDTTVSINTYETLEDMPDLVLRNDFDPDNKKHLLYDPNNMTALYDSLHTIFEKWGHLKNCVLAVFTDGESNSDINTNRVKIFKEIRKLEKDNEWMFHYFGANVDAYKGGNAIGITNTTQCDCSDMSDVFRGVSDSMATMTRAQSQRQTTSSPVLQTLITERISNINYAPFSQNEIDMLEPPRLTRQQAQITNFDDEYVSEFDFGINNQQADV